MAFEARLARQQLRQRRKGRRCNEALRVAAEATSLTLHGAAVTADTDLSASDMCTVKRCFQATFINGPTPVAFDEAERRLRVAADGVCVPLGSKPLQSVVNALFTRSSSKGRGRGPQPPAWLVDLRERERDLHLEVWCDEGTSSIRVRGWHGDVRAYVPDLLRSLHAHLVVMQLDGGAQLRAVVQPFAAGAHPLAGCVAVDYALARVVGIVESPPRALAALSAHVQQVGLDDPLSEGRSGTAPVHKNRFCSCRSGHRGPPVQSFLASCGHGFALECMRALVVAGVGEGRCPACTCPVTAEDCLYFSII